MKKTRILAALLCVMMVVCSLPMVASAKLMAVDYNAMGAIFGTVSTEANTSTTDWPMGMKFDFRNFDATQSGVTSPAGITYDSTNGMTFPADAVTWKYFSPYTDQWSPLAGGEGTGYTVRVKINAGGIINLEACEKYSHDRSYVAISETGITAYERTSGTSFQGCATINAFVPGNDWVDVVVVPDGAGYSVYAKKVTESTFVLVTTAVDYRSGGAWKSTGLSINGKLANVSDAVMIKASDVEAEDPYEVDNTPNPGITDNVKTAIGKVLGSEYAKPATSSADWPAMNLDFTGDFDATQDGMNVSGAVSYDAVDGMVFGSNAGTLRYRPTCQYNGWTPLCISGNYTFNFKLDPDGSFQTQSAKVWSGDDRVYIDFTNKGVTVWVRPEAGSTEYVAAENLVDYKPGTSWNDVMIITNANGGYDLYMKKATDAAFTLVCSTTTYRPGNAWNSTGFTVNANKAKMGYAVSWVSAEKTYDSVEEIVGGNYATLQEFKFDSAFGENLCWNDGSRNIGIISPAGASYTDANGLDMTAAEDPTWRHLPFNGYSAFRTNYKRSAVMFTAKATSTTSGVIQWKSHDTTNNTGRVYINLNTTGVSPWTGGTTTTYSDIAPGNGWVDYLVVPHTDDYGYSLYMKSDSLTGGKWVAKFSCTDDQGTSNYAGTGIELYSANNMYKNLRVIALTDVVKDSETKPAGADYLAYDEEFNAKPDYANANTEDVTVANGKLIVSGGNSFTLNNGEIPLGGYAEIKVKNDSFETYYNFFDGAKVFQINDKKSYGAAGSSGMYLSDGGNIWRIFRVVRNSDGTYSCYTKVEGDASWLKVAVNDAGGNNSRSAQIALNAVANDNYETAIEVEYLKIYSPAVSGNLILTDGYGTKILTDGATATYGESLRYIVNGVSGKLLIVSYAGNDMLKAQIIDAASGNDALVNAKADGATKVKVFLWDGFGKLNRVVPAVTLNF